MMIAASACSSADNGQTRKTVRVSGRPFLSNMPITVADKEGFFADEGLIIDYVELSDHTSQAIPALDNGQLDVIAGITSVGFFNSVAKGAKVRIVADKGHINATSCNYAALIGRRGLFPPGTLSAADIRGKRFSASFVGSNGHLFSRYLTSIGLKESEITVVALPASAEAQALETGAIDGLVTVEPWVSRLVQAGHRLVAPTNTFVPHGQQSVLLYGPSFLVNDRETGAKFMRAFLRGVRRFNEGHTPGNIRLVAEATGIDPQKMSDVCWPPFRPDGVPDTVALADFQNWAFKRKLLDRVVSPKEYHDAEFAREATAALARATKQ